MKTLDHKSISVTPDPIVGLANHALLLWRQLNVAIVAQDKLEMLGRNDSAYKASVKTRATIEADFDRAHKRLLKATAATHAGLAAQYRAALEIGDGCMLSNNPLIAGIPDQIERLAGAV